MGRRGSSRRLHLGHFRADGGQALRAHLYGRSLTMGRLPRLTPELAQQGAAYPQYCVREADICAALEVIDEIAQTNLAAHEESPHYSMLNKKFFSTAAAEAHWVMLRGLTGRHEIVTT